MRLLINTDGIQFRVAGPAKAKPDYKDKERQATTRDGEPIWTVRLDAIEPEREARETIWVEVAGDAAQADLRWLRRGSRPGVRAVGRARRQDQARVPRRVRRAGPVPASPRRPREPARPARNHPLPAIRTKETLMTSIHIYDPGDGAALPELPPLPIGVLAVGTADLLQQAADLPQPRYIFISSTPERQLPVRPGAGERAGHHPLGAAVRQRRDQRAPPGQGRPGDLVPDRLRLLRHRRHGLRPHPGRTGQALERRSSSGVGFRRVTG